MQATINRGSRLLNSLLFEEDIKPATAEVFKSGRNALLIAERDNYLLHRAYYKTKIQRKNYPDTFAELGAELWITKLQIQKIIQSKGDELLQIKRDKPTLAQLQKMWPHVKW